MTDNIFLLLNALFVIGGGTFLSCILVSQLWYHTMLLSEGELNNPIYKSYVQKYDLRKMENISGNKPFIPIIWNDSLKW